MMVIIITSVCLLPPLEEAELLSRIDFDMFRCSRIELILIFGAFDFTVYI